MNKRKTKNIKFLNFILVYISLIIIIIFMPSCSESREIFNSRSETTERMTEINNSSNSEESITSDEDETVSTEQQKENIEENNGNINTQIDPNKIKDDLIRL